MTYIRPIQWYRDQSRIDKIWLDGLLYRENWRQDCIPVPSRAPKEAWWYLHV